MSCWSTWCNPAQAHSARQEAEWNLVVAEIQAERVAFTAWDLRSQELGDAAHNRVVAAREAAADATDELIAQHMKAHFSISSLLCRGGIPMQMQAATQAYADAVPQKEVSQILRLNVINLAARAPTGQSWLGFPWRFVFVACSPVSS